MRTAFEIFDAPEMVALLAFGLIASAAALRPSARTLGRPATTDRHHARDG